jgi:ribonuclease HII
MKRIAGVDEVGRGPLAGPVVAAAVVFPEGYENPRFKDSKQLSDKERRALVEEVKEAAVQWSIVAVGPRRIERLNIREASRLAMKLAVERVAPDFVLVDGNVPIDVPMEQETIVKGDQLHVQISAASIIAKVWRDDLMRTLDARYPGYGFDRHAGYPTARHKEAILRLGPSSAHRATFQGVREHVSRGKESQQVLALSP